MVVNPAAPADLTWAKELFEYQRQGITALVNHISLLLADDMGLGKTIQVIGALRMFWARGDLKEALVITPAGLINQWRRELRFWAPELRVSTVRGSPEERAWQWQAGAAVYLIGYESFRADFTENPKAPARRRTWDVVVLDEAQKIKNRNTEISRVCKMLRRRRAWAVTGTPLENTEDELASILEFVAPLADGERPMHLSYGPKLIAQYHRVQLRRKKHEVLQQLPPKITQQITLPLTGKQKAAYDQAEKEGIVQLQNKGDAVRIQNVLELITRLKQICNFCPTTGQSAKLADLRERLAALQAAGHRALIFSQYTDAMFGVHKLRTELAAFWPLDYTGAQSQTQRDLVIRQFQADHRHKALILSLRAGGQGLNLQDASYVFHFDRWWNPAVEAQAEDRSHRLGQQVPVHVYKYICTDTIEERINTILQRKRLLFDEIVDDVTVDLEASLTAAELYGLFGLTPPGRAGGSGQPAASAAAVAAPATAPAPIPVPDGYVQRAIKAKGWRVHTMRYTDAGGADIIAGRRRIDDIEELLLVRCRESFGPLGMEVVQSLRQTLAAQDGLAQGLIVCPSGFTSAAITLAGHSGITLWDKSDLYRLVK